MTRKTLPRTMPAIRPSSFKMFKRARVKPILDLVHAANWLWANMVRLYGFTAYEGNGAYRVDSHVVDPSDPSANDPLHVPPVSGGVPTLLCSFLCPPNWGPSSTLTVYGASALGFTVAAPTGRIIVGAYDLDGTYLGISGSTTYTASGANTWSISLVLPQDRPVQIKVWMAPTLPLESPPNSDQVIYCCARYLEGVAADPGCSGEAPQTTWQPIAHDYIVAGESPPLSVALLRTIARNLLHLYSQRPPMVLACAFEQPYWNTSTFTTVASYSVHLAPHVTSIKGKLFINCTHGGAGNEVRIYVNGSLKETFTALGTGTVEKTLAAITGLTGGSDITIAIQAKSTAAGADWGTEVLGVNIWEEDVTLSLPAGSSIPANFVAIDESSLTYQAVVDGMMLEGLLLQLIKNVTWLMANRTKNLVSDWRHYAYKNEGQRIASPYEIYEGGNWTRGRDEAASPNGYPGHPKNLTVFAQTSYADAEGSTLPDDKDGQGKYSATLPGMPTSGGWTADGLWPASSAQQWKRHGRRLLRFVTTGASSYAPISGVTGALCLGWLRLRRARPYKVGVYQHIAGAPAADGPQVQEKAFEGRGYVTLTAQGSTTLLAQWGVTGRGSSPDYEPAWYGPDDAKHADFGTAAVRGYLRASKPIYFNTEGAFFEVELLGACFMDAPLTVAALAAL